MNTSAHRLVFALAGLGLALASRAADVIAPAQREAGLAAARTLVAPRITDFPADAIDPFHSTAFVAAVTGVPEATKQPTTGAPQYASDSSLVASLAAALKPSGYFVIGGRETLVFGHKRVVAGDSIEVVYEGATHNVQVTEISRTSFTIRLNGQIVTRPINK